MLRFLAMKSILCVNTSKILRFSRNREDITGRNIRCRVWKRLKDRRGEVDSGMNRRGLERQELFHEGRNEIL